MRLPFLFLLLVGLTQAATAESVLLPMHNAIDFDSGEVFEGPTGGAELTYPPMDADKLLGARATEGNVLFVANGNFDTLTEAEAMDAIANSENEIRHWVGRQTYQTVVVMLTDQNRLVKMTFPVCATPACDQLTFKYHAWAASSTAD